MSSLPPLLPTPLNYAAPPQRNDLRVIAVRQKAVIYSVLGYVVLIIGLISLSDELGAVAGFLAIGVMLIAAVFVFMLSMTVYNPVMGIVLGILTLIPLVGLVVLAIINSKATNILRENGIHVGLMGADSRQIPGPG
jgi:hypothetical protein